MKKVKGLRKLKVGVFSFTCCEGCVISVLESLNSKLADWRDRVEFVNFKALKKVKKVGKMDVAFVEGAISTEDEIVKLKEIRKGAKVLVALGSGAGNGWPSNIRNGFKGAKRERVMKLVAKFGQRAVVVPLKDVVVVDDEIAGCPINEEDFVKKMEELLRNVGSRPSAGMILVGPKLEEKVVVPVVAKAPIKQRIPVKGKKVAVPVMRESLVVKGGKKNG